MASAGEFWENRVREIRTDPAFRRIYPTKANFMVDVCLWFDEPDIGLASIAWDLVSMERGEDNL